MFPIIPFGEGGRGRERGGEWEKGEGKGEGGGNNAFDNTTIVVKNIVDLRAALLTS